MSQMPLAKDGRRVAAGLEHFGQSHLVGMDAGVRFGTKGAKDADAIQ
jgi:hypothetical protein